MMRLSLGTHRAADRFARASWNLAHVPHVNGCVEIKVLRRVRAESSSSTPSTRRLLDDVAKCPGDINDYYGATCTGGFYVRQDDDGGCVIPDQPHTMGWQCCDP